MENQEKSAVNFENLTIKSSEKRADYLEWPDYFMALAFLSAQRSKDPRSQVGTTCIQGWVLSGLLRF